MSSSLAWKTKKLASWTLKVELLLLNFFRKLVCVHKFFCQDRIRKCKVVVVVKCVLKAKSVVCMSIKRARVKIR